jgi:O-antigen ligase
MKNNFKYSDSFSKKIVDYLFGFKSYYPFIKTFWGGLVSKICFPRLSSLLLFLSVISVMYQTVMPQTINKFSPILVILAILLADKSRIIVSKAYLWLIGFYLAISVSAIWGVHSGLDPKMILIGFLIWLQIGLFLVASNPLNIKSATKFLVFAILPISGFGLYQYLSGSTSSALWVSEFETGISFRAFSIMGDPNVYGMLSAIGLTSAIIYGIYKNKNYLLFAPIFGAAVILSFSRTTWLSLVAVFAVVVLLVYPKLIKFSPLTLFVFLVPQIRERVLVVFNSDFLRISSIDGRIWIFNNVMHLFKQSPLVGFGPGSYGGETALKFASQVYHRGIQDGFVPIYYSDSSWLQILVQGGILSIAALIGFFISAIMQIFRTLKVTNDKIYLLGMCGLIFVAVSAVTSNIMEFGPVIIPACLIIGASLNES